VGLVDVSFIALPGVRRGIPPFGSCRAARADFRRIAALDAAGA